MRSAKAVSVLHFQIATVALLIHLGREMTIEDREECFPKEGSASHPLVVPTPPVVVRPVKTPTGKGVLDPVKERLVVGMHSQRHVGLSAVATEMPLPDQDSEEETGLKRSSVLFHRHVSRET